MEIWNVGPFFDNDGAVDWCDELEILPAGRRQDFLRDTLSNVVVNPTDTSVLSTLRGIAAAATVLQLITGVVDLSTPYAPRFLMDSDDVVATAELRELARNAIRIVTTDGSAWRGMWAGDIEEDAALDVIDGLYKALGG